MLIQTNKGLCNGVPILSVVIPVFNQELKIESVIQSLLLNLTVPTELIVIDDASADQSLVVLREVLARFVPLSKHLTQSCLFSFQIAAFETHCDCFGMENAKADYVLELQADMYINEPGFDRKMIDAIRKYPDILMLSGRGTENIAPVQQEYSRGLGSQVSSSGSFILHIFSRLLRRSRFLGKLLSQFRAPNVPQVKTYPHGIESAICPDLNVFEKTGEAGRLGDLIEENILPGSACMWVGETVMRGPLLIDKKKYFEVGGFDRKRFFQGYDDHDLAIRAWDLCSYRSAYVPVGFDNPLNDGTTRKGRTLRQEFDIFKNLCRIHKRWQNSTLYRAQDILSKKPLHPQIRNL
jgi:glycosyltransferase involved in cell wall biosynthesis